MLVIEASSYRSFTLKVPKADWVGTEERFRPHEEVSFHAGLRAQLGPGDDVTACQGELDDRCATTIEQAVKDYRNSLPKGVTLEPARPTMRAPAGSLSAAPPVMPPRAPAPPAAPSPPRPSAEQRGRIAHLRDVCDKNKVNLEGLTTPQSQPEAYDLIKVLESRLAAKGVRA